MEVEVKRKDDGLPDNPLYNRFVRAGDGFSKMKKFHHSDDEEEDSRDVKPKDRSSKMKEKTARKEKKNAKKDKEKKGKRVPSASDDDHADNGSSKSQVVAAEKDANKKGKKRKRDPKMREESGNTRNTKDGATGSNTELPWGRTIKGMLKEAPGRELPLNELRKNVLQKLREVIGNSLGKAEQKAAFKEALKITPKIERHEKEGEKYVRYKNNSKQQKA